MNRITAFVETVGELEPTYPHDYITIPGTNIGIAFGGAASDFPEAPEAPKLPSDDAIAPRNPVRLADPDVDTISEKKTI